MDESYGLLLMDSRGLRLPHVISRLSTSLARAGIQSRPAGNAGSGSCLTKHTQCVFDPTAPENVIKQTSELRGIWTLEAFILTFLVIFSSIMFSFCCWLRFSRKGFLWS